MNTLIRLKNWLYQLLLKLLKKTGLFMSKCYKEDVYQVKIKTTNEKQDADYKIMETLLYQSGLEEFFFWVCLVSSTAFALSYSTQNGTLNVLNPSECNRFTLASLMLTVISTLFWVFFRTSRKDMKAAALFVGTIAGVGLSVAAKYLIQL